MMATQRADTTPLLMTPEELASHLGISVRALYMRSERGQVPGRVKIRRSLRFDRRVVLEWLAEIGCASAKP